MAGLEVVLETYDGNEQVGTATALTDEEGRFTFAGLPTAPNLVSQALVRYEGADYYSGPASFSADAATAALEVVVYEATPSDELIVVSNAHTIVEMADGGLRITEVLTFVNQGDRSYVGSVQVAEGANATLYFPLPEGAVELQPGTGLMQCCIYGYEEGFVDSMPFPPGEQQVIYSYFVPNTDSEYTFVRPVAYPTGRYDLLVQGESVSIQSSGLISDQPVTMKDAPFAHSSSEGVEAGEAIEASISGLPDTGLGNILIWAGITVGLLAGGYGVFLTRRRRARPPSLPVETPVEERQRLLVQIAEMDDDFAAGRIAEDTFRRRRAAVKARLVDLTRQVRQGQMATSR